MKPRRHRAFILVLFLLLISVIAAADKAEALQFRLGWIDASKNEDGFKVERKRGNGKYVRIATLGANVTSYVDSTVAPGAAYCYRVRAFNRKGSAASSPACATTRADITITKAGTGNGTVVSVPAGINCGATCSANYPGLTVVTLTPIPAPGSVFSGWSGPKDCKNGVVTMNANKQCTAHFQPPGPSLAATGSTTPNPVNPASGAKTAPKPVNLASAAKIAPNPANPAPIAKNNSAATATQPLPVSIGVFRPSTGEWFLDQNGSGFMGACNVASCVRNLGDLCDVPVVGSWTGAPTTSLGLFDRSTASWYLDLNGNGVLDGCEANACRHVYGKPGDVPVVGDWTGGGKTNIGVCRPSSGRWQLDINGDGDFDGCGIDLCSRIFGVPGDLPVVGDWTGAGQTKIGLFRPGTGEWLLDSGDMGESTDCADDCIVFGAPGDLPVVGDWDGAGADKIGVFRPSTGEWMLDLNGDSNWDGCGVDLCLGPFGAPGDLPVVGKWM